VAVHVEGGGRYVYVAGKGSNNVSAFTISGPTGALTPVAAGSNPSGLTILNTVE